MRSALKKSSAIQGRRHASPLRLSFQPSRLRLSWRISFSKSGGRVFLPPLRTLDPCLLQELLLAVQRFTMKTKLSDSTCALETRWFYKKREMLFRMSSESWKSSGRKAQSHTSGPRECQSAEERERLSESSDKRPGVA